MNDYNPRPILSSRLATIAVIVGTVGLALAIRIAWPYPNVFVDGNVWFRGMDAWYHMRLVDSFIANFPLTTEYDPFSWYPHGIEPPFHPLTGWLIGGTAILFGGGTPSAHAVDVSGAVLPAILGSLTVVPAYFIGRRLFGPVAGAVSAIALAIAPGEFLSRTLLGFADHHMAEAFFSALTLMCLVIAIERASSNDVRLSTLPQEASGSARSTIIWTVLSGIALGLYLLAWRGGLMLPLILFIYTVVRGMIDYIHSRSYDDVVLVISGTILIGAIMVSPLASTHWTPELFILALVGSVLAPVAMKLLSLWARSRGFSPKAFVAMLLGCGGIVVVVAAAAFPAAFKGAIAAINFMVPSGSGFAITEMQPLFLPGGEFSVRVAWTNFTTVLPVSLIGLVALLRARQTLRGNDVLLFLIWSITMLSAVLSQRRFGYYYMLNASVLTGLVVSLVFQSEWSQRQLGLVRRVVQPVHAKNKAARRAMQSQLAARRGAIARLAIVALAIVAVIAVPCVEMAHNFAVERSLMTPGWWETLNW
ncbi:MAG: glycosyltransferase family 39 protein, partial [Dehalococcoidia bacterium]|nr:glycosyltransferase family 39 protein [Dehalococcoidia bacterium]